MKLLPTNDKFYKNGLDKFNKEDFIYYRHINRNEIYMHRTYFNGR